MGTQYEAKSVESEDFTALIKYMKEGVKEELIEVRNEIKKKQDHFVQQCKEMQEMTIQQCRVMQEETV